MSATTHAAFSLDALCEEFLKRMKELSSDFPEYDSQAILKIMTRMLAGYLLREDQALRGFFRTIAMPPTTVKPPRAEKQFTTAAVPAEVVTVSSDSESDHSDAESSSSSSSSSNESGVVEELKRLFTERDPVLTPSQLCQRIADALSVSWNSPDVSESYGKVLTQPLVEAVSALTNYASDVQSTWSSETLSRILSHGLVEVKDITGVQTCADTHLTLMLPYDASLYTASAARLDAVVDQALVKAPYMTTLANVLQTGSTTLGSPQVSLEGSDYVLIKCPVTPQTFKVPKLTTVQELESFLMDRFSISSSDFLGALCGYRAITRASVDEIKSVVRPVLMRQAAHLSQDRLVESLAAALKLADAVSIQVLSLLLSCLDFESLASTYGITTQTLCQLVADTLRPTSFVLERFAQYVKRSFGINLTLTTLKSTDMSPSVGITLPRLVHPPPENEYVGSAKKTYNHRPSPEAQQLTAPHDLDGRAIIESIRIEEYLIGRDELANQRQRTARAVRRLAEDLYQEDVHVIYELIQNSDDCAYPADQTPAVTIYGCDQGLLLVSNELGLSERDVRALSDIALSTKAEDAVKTIGKFGIGFKSVFMVSDTPALFDRNFQFGFVSDELDIEPLVPNLSLTSDVIPFVCPYWIEASIESVVHPDIIALVHDHLGPTVSLTELQRRGSIVYLPRSKVARKVHRFRELTEGYMKDPKEDDFIFLRKLQQLQFVTYGSWTQIQRVVSVPTEDGVFMKSQVTLSRLTADDLVGAHIKVWSITSLMAASVDAQQTLFVNVATSPERVEGRVFVGLPVCASGLPFHVNGNFVVSANREGLKLSDKVNLTLRDMVGDVVVSMMQELNSLPLAGDLDESVAAQGAVLGSLERQLSLIPIASRCMEFMKPLSRRLAAWANENTMIPQASQPVICKSLRDCRLLPTKALLNLSVQEEGMSDGPVSSASLLTQILKRLANQDATFVPDYISNFLFTMKHVQELADSQMLSLQEFSASDLVHLLKVAIGVVPVLELFSLAVMLLTLLPQLQKDGQLRSFIRSSVDAQICDINQSTSTRSPYPCALDQTFRPVVVFRLKGKKNREAAIKDMQLGDYFYSGGNLGTLIMSFAKEDSALKSILEDEVERVLQDHLMVPVISSRSNPRSICRVLKPLIFSNIMPTLDNQQVICCTNYFIQHAPNWIQMGSEKLRILTNSDCVPLRSVYWASQRLTEGVLQAPSLSKALKTSSWVHPAYRFSEALIKSLELRPCFDAAKGCIDRLLEFIRAQPAEENNDLVGGLLDTLGLYVDFQIFPQMEEVFASVAQTPCVLVEGALYPFSQLWLPPANKTAVPAALRAVPASAAQSLSRYPAMIPLLKLSKSPAYETVLAQMMQLPTNKSGYKDWVSCMEWLVDKWDAEQEAPPDVVPPDFTLMVPIHNKRSCIRVRPSSSVWQFDSNRYLLFCLPEGVELKDAVPFTWKPIYLNLFKVPEVVDREIALRLLEAHHGHGYDEALVIAYANSFKEDAEWCEAFKQLPFPTIATCDAEVIFDETPLTLTEAIEKHAVVVDLNAGDAKAVLTKISPPPKCVGHIVSEKCGVIERYWMDLLLRSGLPHWRKVLTIHHLPTLDNKPVVVPPLSQRLQELLTNVYKRVLKDTSLSVEGVAMDTVVRERIKQLQAAIVGVPPPHKLKCRYKLIPSGHGHGKLGSGILEHNAASDVDCRFVLAVSPPLLKDEGNAFPEHIVEELISMDTLTITTFLELSRVYHPFWKLSTSIGSALRSAWKDIDSFSSTLEATELEDLSIDKSHSGWHGGGWGDSEWHQLSMDPEPVVVDETDIESLDKHGGAGTEKTVDSKDTAPPEMLDLGAFEAEIIPVTDQLKKVSQATVAEIEEYHPSAEGRRKHTGRLGEQLTYASLMEENRNKILNNEMEVQWINEHKEKGLPYDILVKTKSEDGVIEESYIEVKATGAGQKQMFEISHPEWQFAQLHGDHYSIYRLFNVGRSKMTITRIRNPYAQWRSRRIGFMLCI
eukprot:Blabericola_migrator_1__4978@NODE_258_length_10736_cov_58_864373_g216_i0_p1_GENE_NODE_258_length_10736_cov_58_864373_g216_i0NODE_258_length_10736_cov_58_864373_g216_i0_p1_ORF_typecomplete_len2197_score344_77DUF3883/PF13020_6/3_5e22SWIM/PF04434_17/2_7e05HATPase_c_3/PF13589_6/0_00013Fur_reg_FbpB/PF13040_6/0_11Chorion_2/PF03964_15/0_85_NODE_258_length_10736_cov_58_864373_g216_i05866591